jgi:hypothetical protein
MNLSMLTVVIFFGITYSDADLQAYRVLTEKKYVATEDLWPDNFTSADTILSKQRRAAHQGTPPMRLWQTQPVQPAWVYRPMPVSQPQYIRPLPQNTNFIYYHYLFHP